MAERESKRPRRVEEESVSEEDGDNDTTTDAVISAFEAFEPLVPVSNFSAQENDTILLRRFVSFCILHFF